MARKSRRRNPGSPDTQRRVLRALEDGITSYVSTMYDLWDAGEDLWDFTDGLESMVRSEIDTLVARGPDDGRERVEVEILYVLLDVLNNLEARSWDEYFKEGGRPFG